MKSKDAQSALHLISQSGVLMQLKRSHHKHLGTTFDTVSSHSHQTAVVSYILARMENMTHEEAQKCVTIAVFHDLPEARTSDFDFIAKQYSRIDEEKAILDQTKDLEFGADLKQMFDEYEIRESKEAKVVKDADSLTQMFTEWVLMWQGNKLAEKWFLSDFNDRYPAFFTNSAKEIADQMKASNPNEWWWSEFMEEDAAKDKELLLGKKKK